MTTMTAPLPTPIDASVTPEDLLLIPDAINFELVDGRLVERNMGMESSRVGMNVGAALIEYCNTHGAGDVFGSDAGYRCYPDAPDKVRKPDVSLILAGRLPGGVIPKGYCSVVPDLVVEVISPNDLSYDVEEKVREYLTAGVKLVWVVHPPGRVVRVHRQRGSAVGNVSELFSSETITGDDILPEFSCPVAKFFKGL